MASAAPAAKRLVLPHGRHFAIIRNFETYCLRCPRAGCVVVRSLSGEKERGAVLLTDVVLLDQDGKANRFYSDLIKGKVVVESDTPEKLKEYSHRFKARPGWVLPTGKKEDVGFILNKLG